MTSWFNKLSKKSKIVILVGALIMIGFLWFKAWQSATPVATNDQRPTTNTSADTEPDFVKTGTINSGIPGLKRDTTYLIFEESGAPALSKELVFNEKSICRSISNDTAPCLSWGFEIQSFVLDGRRATVSGISQPDGALLVKTLSLEKQ